MNLKEAWAVLWGNANAANAQNYALTINQGTEKVTDYSNVFKTNAKLGRQLYHNTNKNYLLAAQLVKPIVNNNVNFIGIPSLLGNKKALKILNDVRIDYRTVHKELENAADIFVWPQWDPIKSIIKLELVPIDVVQEIFIDPITKEELGYRFAETINYPTPAKTNNEIKIEYVITKDIIIRLQTGAVNKKESMVNPFGFLPIVHFSNDRDLNDIYGHAEVENIEPQLKFYHELTYEAGAAQSRDGHPKMKITTANPKVWVDNNFGTGAWESVKAGNTTLSMADRDLFINAKDDDVNYIYLAKTTGDYGPLAETTFTNIVEGSETPEINFGANIGTSLASVKEQRPVWVKKIEAKQYERTQPWLDVYEIILNIHNFVKLTNVKNDIEMVWAKPNFVSVKEQSEIIDSFSKAIEKLKTDGDLTKEEVYNTLIKLDIFEMFETYKEHKEVSNVEETEQAKKISDAKAEEATNKDTDEEAKADAEDDKD